MSSKLIKYVCITLNYTVKDVMACKLLLVACVSLPNNWVINSMPKFRVDVKVFAYITQK